MLEHEPSVGRILRGNRGHDESVRLEESTGVSSWIFLVPVAYRQPNPNKLQRTSQMYYTKYLAFLVRILLSPKSIKILYKILIER